MNELATLLVKMNPCFFGSWISHRSEIPDFISGREWVHFYPSGDHQLELLQPGQDVQRKKFSFTLRKESGRYRFLFSKDPQVVRPPIEFPMDIEKLNDAEISLTPHLPRHGFTTVFRRIEPQQETPSQSP